MLKNSKIRAEELLTNEKFSEEFLTNAAKEEIVDSSEIQMARKISSFLHSYHKGLTFWDKKQTKDRIRQSIRKHKIKKQIIRWSVAAAILFATILSYYEYSQIKSPAEITQFAKTIEDVKAGQNTRIILHNGEEVQTDKKQSQIRYDSNGESITINSDKKIVQKVNHIDLVFNTVIVPFGKRAQITLSEGTKVWLNSGSKLIYPAVFASNKREVYIDGEAIFDVTHMEDKPFIVSTTDFDIKVLGTVFNVSSYSDDKYSSTVLERGKIELFCRGNSILHQKKLNIVPGTMAVFNRNQKTFDQQEVNPQKYLSWREGYLIFKSERLEDILKKLGRYYNIEMVINDAHLKNAAFSGLLDLKNSPEEVLSIIMETTSFSYHIDQEKIFINPK